MWPWEHLAVGYLLLSLGIRAAGHAPPGPTEVGALVVATQLPDVVDKPLSWGLEVFPTGYAIGHAAVVAVPAGVGLVLLGRRAGAGRTWSVVVVGYWSHLAADVVDPVRFGLAPDVGRVLWPFVSATPYRTDLGLRRGIVYLERFLSSGAVLERPGVLVLSVGVPLFTLALWVLDGAPGFEVLDRAGTGDE